MQGHFDEEERGAEGSHLDGEGDGKGRAGRESGGEPRSGPGAFEGRGELEGRGEREPGSWDSIEGGSGRAPHAMRELVGAVVSWALIAAVVLWTIGEGNDAREANGGAERENYWMLEVQGRHLVGTQSLSGGDAVGLEEIPAFADSFLDPRHAIDQQLGMLETGSVGQRLRIAILRRELQGATAAQASLDRTRALIEESDQPLAAEEARQLESLETILAPECARESTERSDGSNGVGSSETTASPETTEGSGDPTAAVAAETSEEIEPREASDPVDVSDDAATSSGPSESAPVEETKALAVVDEAERRRLEDELGWFGRLLVSSIGDDPTRRAEVEAEARSTALTLGVSMAIVLAAIAGGFVVLFVGMLLLRSKRLRFGLPPTRATGGVYLETFAVWIVVFVSLGVVGRTVGSIWWQVIAFPLSAAALVWPRLRGHAWRDVAEDIGLRVSSGSSASRRSELRMGPVGYVLSLPFLLAGVLVSAPFLFAWIGGRPLEGARALLLAAGALEPKSMPSHPAVEMLVEGDFATRLAIFLLATVAAPLIEEIFFRGVLYRHLRWRTWRLGPVRSWLFAGAFSSFLFAIVHPQGAAAVPALMGLAIGFCLVREWRGSLLPAMVAHGINNGALLLLVLLLA